MANRKVQIFFIVIIILYSMLIFVMLALDDLLESENQRHVFHGIEGLELLILVIFLFEVGLSSFGQGVKIYFRDKWLVCDLFIIILSIILVILDLSTDLQFTISKILGLVRAFFRFMRVFLVVRKISNMKII